MQGESSTAEEQLLRQYFASPDAEIRGEHLYAKVLFGYFDAAAAEKCPAIKPQRGINPLLRFARTALPLAAAVVLALLLAPTYGDSERVAYCYINGQPIYDRDFAESQAELALTTLASTLRLQNQAVDNILENLLMR